ncbi:MAG: hypothetical protein M1822_010019 [Bathelium mastoideum]|nr:MAG: hypothetical protein M1822_010019 [Bathelium mastoideum]
MGPTRQVDSINRPIPRPKKMKVLCLGFSRTGTKSLYTALKILGYTPYHGAELFTPENLKHHHMKCWTEGLIEKGKGFSTYGVVEFDKLLGQYDATTDGQSALFVDELITAYPEAKVILTTRDPDAWIRSMDRFYYRISTVLRWSPSGYLDSIRWRPLKELAHALLDELTHSDRYNRKALRRGFLAHNTKVRKTVPAPKLLDFQVKDGWDPLCKFLGTPIPDVPFPFINEGNIASNTVIVGVIIDMLMRSLTPLGALAVLWLAWKMLDT